MTALVAVLSLLPGFYVTQESSAAAPQATEVKQETKAIKVLVDGEEVKFGTAGPRAIGGATMVPFRPLFEALGANVEYDLVHKIVKANKENNEIELQIGERIGKKNGAEITMGNPPVLIKGVTYVPLRFVAEALEAKVDYDKATQVITIDTSGDGESELMGCGIAPNAKTVK